MASSSGPPVGRAVATTSSSSAAIDIPTNKTCGGGCGCSCDCGCSKCSCRSRVDVSDPNREEYGGEGTLLGIGAHAIIQPTSFTSTDSMGSVQESSNAPMPTATTTTITATTTAVRRSFDTIRNLHGRQDPTHLAQMNMARYLGDLDDECPWDNFLEKSDGTMDEDLGLFGPIEVEGSMRNHDSGDHSMLSSLMSSISFHTPSDGMSDVVRGMGGVFGPRGPMRLN